MCFYYSIIRVITSSQTRKKSTYFSCVARDIWMITRTEFLAAAILSIFNLSGSRINILSDTLSDLIVFTDCQAGLYDTVSSRQVSHPWKTLASVSFLWLETDLPSLPVITEFWNDAALGTHRKCWRAHKLQWWNFSWDGQVRNWSQNGLMPE